MSIVGPRSETYPNEILIDPRSLASASPNLLVRDDTKVGQLRMYNPLTLRNSQQLFYKLKTGKSSEIGPNII